MHSGGGVIFQRDKSLLCYALSGQGCTKRRHVDHYNHNHNRNHNPRGATTPTPSHFPATFRRGGGGGGLGAGRRGGLRTPTYMA